MASAKTTPARVDSTIGKNITASVQNDILTLTIDLSKRLGPSASGKTIIVATSGGNQKIDGCDVVAGLNFYVKS